MPVNGTSDAQEVARSAADGWGLKNCTGPPATGHSSVETNDPGDLLTMAPPLEPVLDYLETLAGGPDSADADLLRRFADARDEAAFAAILHRHGPMVLAA